VAGVRVEPREVAVLDQLQPIGFRQAEHADTEEGAQMAGGIELVSSGVEHVKSAGVNTHFRSLSRGATTIATACRGQRPPANNTLARDWYEGWNMAEGDLREDRLESALRVNVHR